MNTNDGGQAFPIATTYESKDYMGMSLRDYFAAHVTVDESDIPSTQGQCCALIGATSFPSQTDVLERAVACAKLEAVIRGMKADAMIEEREKFLARTKSKA